MLSDWNDLPDEMKLPEVKPYYDLLCSKKVSLSIKRCFDFTASILMLIILCPVMAVIAAMIKADSPGPVIFKQKRITANYKEFDILKFRSMVNDADKGSGQLTTSGDPRITKVGSMLRNTRLDELPQLYNVFKGEMSFVGVRPEVPRYVEHYTNEMMATLLLPAGVTSEASIMFKDEYKMLSGKEDASKAYVEKVLPEKMRYNLQALEHFSLKEDLNTMLRTILAVVGIKIKEVKYKSYEKIKQ